MLLILLIIGGIVVFRPDWLPEQVRAYIHEEEENAQISVTGNVEVREVDVGFTLSGRLEEVFAEEGQQVQEGEQLATVEQTKIKDTIIQRRAALDEARAALENLQSGSRQQEIDAAEAKLTAVNAELEKAKEDYERVKALYEDEFASESELDAARTAYEATQAQQKQAQEQLDLVQAGPTEETLEAAQARVTQAQAALDLAEEQLDDATISAPIAGVILKKNMEAGEIVSPGVPVYTIGDLAHPWVTVYVKEDKLGLVKLGQTAEISVDSYPNKTYPGEVTHIASEAEFTPKNVQTKEERVKLVFEVEVSVENPNRDLKPGMPADVEILLNETGS